MSPHSRWILVLFVAGVIAGCGESDSDDPSSGRGGRGGRGGPGGGSSGSKALLVETATVERADVSSYIETNGTLEAENEVDIVARTSGPIVKLEAEEMMEVKKGQLLARIDPAPVRAQLEIARVERQEAQFAFDRAKTLHERSLVSSEVFEQARSRLESAEAQYQGNRLQLSYTEIRAPFDGVIVLRHVKLAENIATNAPLFRLSDFDPMLCLIQVPERELPQLEIGQEAYLTFEPWPERRFFAVVLRVSPVVDAGTGTVRVTLKIDRSRSLRPGMFASVFLRTATHKDAITIPKRALALESIGDTVYVADGTTASRRAVELGFREGDLVEIKSGVQEGEQVVTVGQDGLADGTEIQVVVADGKPVRASEAAPAAADEGEPRAGRAGREGREGREGRGGRRGDFDPSKMTPEMLEQMKKRMKARGMTDAQIEERIKSFGKKEGSKTP